MIKMNIIEESFKEKEKKMGRPGIAGDWKKRGQNGILPGFFTKNQSERRMEVSIFGSS